jgi:hypothetical protein
VAKNNFNRLASWHTLPSSLRLISLQIATARQAIIMDATGQQPTVPSSVAVPTTTTQLAPITAAAAVTQAMGNNRVASVATARTAAPAGISHSSAAAVGVTHSTVVLRDTQRAVEFALIGHAAEVLSVDLRACYDTVFAKHEKAIQAAGAQAQTNIGAYREAMTTFWDEVFQHVQAHLLRLGKTYDSSAFVTERNARPDGFCSKVKSAVIRVRIQWLDDKSFTQQPGYALTADAKIRQLSEETTDVDITVLVVSCAMQALFNALAAPTSVRQLFEYAHIHETYIFRPEVIPTVLERFIPNVVLDSLNHFADVPLLAQTSDSLMIKAREQQRTQRSLVSCNGGGGDNGAVAGNRSAHVSFDQHRQMLELVQDDHRKQMNVAQQMMLKSLAMMETQAKDILKLNATVEALEQKYTKMNHFVQNDVNTAFAKLNETFTQVNSFHGKLNRDFDVHRRSVEGVLDNRKAEQATELQQLQGRVDAQLQDFEDRLSRRLIQMNQSIVNQLQHWFDDYASTLNEVHDNVNGLTASLFPEDEEAEEDAEDVEEEEDALQQHKASVASSASAPVSTSETIAASSASTTGTSTSSPRAGEPDSLRPTALPPPSQLRAVCHDSDECKETPAPSASGLVNPFHRVSMMASSSILGLTPNAAPTQATTSAFSLEGR